MRSSSGRLSFPTPGVRPFARLSPERPSSSTFTFVGFSRAEEVLSCMAPSSCSAVPDRTSAIRKSGRHCCFTRVTPIAHSSRSPRRGSRRRHSLSAHLDSSRRGLLRRHSLSTHLNPPHRGLLPVSHVFVDSSRLFCFLIAPPGQHCVRLPSVRAVCISSGLPRFCGCAQCSPINRPASSLFLPCHPWLAITCTAFGSLHVLLARLTISPCTFLCAGSQLTHVSRCCFAPLGGFIVCTQLLA